MKIGEFLLRRLKEAGVRHLFGVPGDYNLVLLHQLQDSGALTCSAGTSSDSVRGRWFVPGDGARAVDDPAARPQAGHLPHQQRRIHDERGYLGKNETYNDIAKWAYADLPKVFHPGTSARSFVVKTVGDLQRALTAPNDTMILVESIMDAHDVLASVITSSNKGADLDYGPRGPQRREGLQLRPATQTR